MEPRPQFAFVDPPCHPGTEPPAVGHSVAGLDGVSEEGDGLQADGLDREGLKEI